MRVEQHKGQCMSLYCQKCLDKIVRSIKMGIRLQRNKETVFPICGRNSAVECQLPKLDVVGSSPIARSK
jgi:hypothetical protein